MNGLERALLGGWAMIAVAAGCSSSVTGPDSETHWLGVCNRDADCADGLSCLCRTCTRSCTLDTCSTLGASAECVTPADSAVAAGCATPLDGAVCTTACSRDADCVARGPALHCLGGACLTGAGGGGAGTGSGGAGTGSGGAGTGSGGAGTGGGAAGTGSGGVPAACIRPLTQSGCAETYQDALAAIQCPAPISGSQSLATCGVFRVVGGFYVDVAQTCAYDANGALVAGSTCSKPIGGCNCFQAGDVINLVNACQGSVSTDPCAPDGGKN